MRNHQTIINEAMLLALPPVQVFQWLEERATKGDSKRYETEADDELEKALLARNDELITLGLARYCRYAETARSIFESQDANNHDTGLRLAVLTNHSITASLMGRYPVDLFSDANALSAWLSNASLIEIRALFENPNLHDQFLRALLEGKAFWQGMDKTRQLATIYALADNPRMKTPYDDQFMDGYAEYTYESVSVAAWGLASTAPTTKPWAAALSNLFEKLPKNKATIKDPLAVAARWIPTPDDKPEEPLRGYLSNHEGVRKGLAMMAVMGKSALLPTLLASDDPAFRSAAYACARLTVEQLHEAYERDQELAFNMAVHNRNLWHHEDTRQALHDIAWKVVNEDNHSDLMAANIYTMVQEEVAKEYPDWFKEATEDVEIDPAELPASKEDIQLLADSIGNPSESVHALHQTVLQLNSRLGWVWWFSLGALVASLWHL